MKERKKKKCNTNSGYNMRNNKNFGLRNEINRRKNAKK